MDAVPRGMSLDDPRLPSIRLDPAPLRLNTHPVPAAILAGAGSGHAAHVAALTAWLLALAGDWAAHRRRLVTDYLAFAADEITRNQAAIADRLVRYDGLYTPDDYFWSALRPLPRAWLVIGDTVSGFADLAFWDGRVMHAAGLRAAQVPSFVSPFEAGAWPEACCRFWADEKLPQSPLRRADIR